VERATSRRDGPLTRLSIGIAAVLVTAGCSLVLSPEEPRHPVLEITNVEIGVPHQLDISTHCGFRRTTINGDTWVPVDGSIPRDGTNVFGMNVTRGTVVLTDADHAVFTTSTNFAIQLRRVGGPEPTFPACI